MSRVVVLGGGVIGLASAYELAQRGERALVLDRGVPGGACSAGNLGWIVPSLSEPLPAPGLAWTSVKWMLRRESPLYVDPRFALRAAPWLWRFWRHCNARDYERGLEAVGGLNGRTLERFDALEADGVDFEMHRAGLLFLFHSVAARERSFAEFEALAALGLASPSRLDPDEVLGLEPGIAPGVAGGVMIAGERHVRPETLSAGLARRARELGAEVRGGVEVTDVIRRGGRVTGIVTADGTLEADALVLAAGSWSGRIARRLGFPLPIQPGKGYSVTIRDPAAAPARPLYLSEMRVGLSPFDGAIRLGGTMELSGFGPRIVPARVAAIRRAAARYYPGAAEGGDQVEWMGLRPLTPDGLPAIGRAPGWENVFVATGHAMLGVTLAPVTGLAVAELVTGGESSFDLGPFDPGRFGRKVER
ncbi:MAG TPA: FAD-dependent oxidoreductase [Longimicrobiales bacterium]|nr:FAD-dependent oxidoreductase [Longimicrobiales bacterium]